MWKPSQPEPPSPPQRRPSRYAPPRRLRRSNPRIAPELLQPTRPPSAKGLFIKGEITGSESLFIDGKVEGSINLNGNRVTVGRNGQVAASITAREVVVLGKVRGNVTATDRVDIRAEGALTGDVAAARISIEDGAFFKGGIDIRKPDAAKPAATPAATAVAGHCSGQVKQPQPSTAPDICRGCCVLLVGKQWSARSNLIPAGLPWNAPAPPTGKPIRKSARPVYELRPVPGSLQLENPASLPISAQLQSLDRHPRQHRPRSLQYHLRDPQPQCRSHRQNHEIHPAACGRHVSPHRTPQIPKQPVKSPTLTAPLTTAATAQRTIST